MKLYFAGALTKKHAREELLRQGKNESFLESFINFREIERVLTANPQIKIFLDSGAFSAWSRGKDVDLDAYIAFYKKWENQITCLACLDKIPEKGSLGSVGAWKTEGGSLSYSQKYAEEGWKNYEYMLEQGVPSEKLVHIFHMGEKFDWLKRLIETSGGYIGLSPANDSSAIKRLDWLSKCTEYVAESSTKAKVKFHGFAVTGIDMMRVLPWYSVDSLTWGVGGLYGFIYVPKWKKRLQKFDYLDPYQIFVTDRALGTQEKADLHIHKIKEERRRENVLEYLKLNGFTLEEVYDFEGTDEKNYKNRDVLNLKYFLEIEKNITCLNPVKKRLLTLEVDNQ